MAVLWAQGMGLRSAACADVFWACRPLGQDSCPLPPSAVPNSHGGPGGTRDHPLSPLVRRCQFAGKLLWNFVLERLEF